MPAAVLLAGLLPVGRWPLTALTAAAVALPWHLWSWWHLGGFVPDTLWLKAGEGAWYGYRFTTGIGLYWHDFPAATALSVAVVLAGVAAAAVTRQRVAVVSVAAATAHVGAMCVLDPPPYAWYYAPALMLCALAFVVGVVEVSGPHVSGPHVSGPYVWVAIGLVVCIGVAGVLLDAPAPTSPP